MAEPSGSATLDINIQMAVQTASNYLKSLEPFIGDEIKDVRLEEVELSEDEQFWFITLGFNRPVDSAFAVIQNQTQREYKTFKIDTTTGKVKAMTIRTV